MIPQSERLLGWELERYKRMVDLEMFQPLKVWEKNSSCDLSDFDTDDLRRLMAEIEILQTQNEQFKRYRATAYGAKDPKDKVIAELAAEIKRLRGAK
jgi:hypothetical protein